MKFKKAEDYIKYLDEQSGEAWSNDNELLADAMQDYAKMYHEQIVKNCSKPDSINSLTLTERRDYLKGWEDGIEYFNNTKNNDC